MLQETILILLELSEIRGNKQVKIPDHFISDNIYLNMRLLILLVNVSRREVRNRNAKEIVFLPVSKNK